LGFEKNSYLKFNAANYKPEFKKLRQRIIAWGKPDILVYCAGQRFYKEKLTSGEKLLTRKVNYDCPRYIINQILKKDTKFNPRAIIIISSMLAGKKHKYLQEYCDSKELINIYIKKIASKFEGTAFFSVCPGITLTPMTEERSTLYGNMVKVGKLRKILNSSEVAKLVYQISKGSKYASGSRIFIGDV
jgi:short-subunit dehydrogenase